MLNAVAIAGPGNSIRPAVRTSSCQTEVRNSTPESSIAPKPPKNRTDAPTARPKLRTRSIDGSTIGATWRLERNQMDERTDRDDQPERAEHVGSQGVALAPLDERAPAEAEAEQADGHVDEEHQAPIGLDEQAAERWSGG